MAKKMFWFRLSEVGQKDLQVCYGAAGRRAAKLGLPGPSRAEVVEQALARYAKYLSSLKLEGKGVKSKKKAP